MSHEARGYVRTRVLPGGEKGQLRIPDKPETGNSDLTGRPGQRMVRLGSGVDASRSRPRLPE